MASWAAAGRMERVNLIAIDMALAAGLGANDLRPRDTFALPLLDAAPLHLGDTIRHAAWQHWCGPKTRVWTRRDRTTASTRRHGETSERNGSGSCSQPTGQSQ